MTTSVTKPCFTTQHQTCKTKTKTIFLSQTGLVLRPTVSDHITVKQHDVDERNSDEHDAADTAGLDEVDLTLFFFIRMLYKDCC